MRVTVGVLGPVAAWDADGRPLGLKGPRHRAVLARLVVARRRVVPVPRLVADLWDEPPKDAVSALRTFVAALRRALEPDRPPRARPRLLVTEGPGYALRLADERVDAWRFERAVTDVAELPPAAAVARLTEALGWWRGPAYADVAGADWARTAAGRLAELRCQAVERRAEAQIALGAAAEAVPDLDAYLSEHPWREDAWQLLVLALYRSGRQADALAVVRRARHTLAERLGVDPGPRLRRLEADVLRQAEHLDPGPGGSAAQIWAQATAAYERALPPSAHTRLESTAGLMRDLAVTGGGGLAAAGRHRVAAVAAAEQLGDPLLTARVIGIYDVPANWTRADDPEQARWLVAAAERTLAALPAGAPERARARLLGTVALESRGTLPVDRPATADRAYRAAAEAERIARRLADGPLLAFALNGVWMQTFERTGLAGRRDAIGAEVLDLARRHELVRYEVLGHLIRLQARAALADPAGADRHATAADRLAERHGLALVGVFTTWYRASRVAATGSASAAEAAYRRAAEALVGAGMPGLAAGLPAVAALSLALRHGGPLPEVPAAEWGPYEVWVRPLLTAWRGERAAARAALRALPAPPRDLMSEALWCLVGRAALLAGEHAALARAVEALRPAAGEVAGAQGGLLDLGPVAEHLAAWTAELAGNDRPRDD
ncbi:AfsR/SARP family transcriptional regulator [Streptomyces sp. DSM 44915]|uniref:AfsR/SARP family transcriptional regulator n=1 Tax=Streptomyces chisholmiae TaxID=3075540 RepID=A0ABU2JZ32_9ACTN|nr:AfsR/SARP family transcriptional regulator [Streptomyces sp. DSM 44915]MDT0270224.1 AfsR/SARP family transcriptional regulator [Streptomyces sp. DSM 44915]